MPFWFNEYRPAPAAREGAYRRKYGTTWWGKQFLDALERADNSGRLSRGKTFEEKIDQLINSKRDLAGLSVNEGGSFLGRMSNEELSDFVKL